MPKYVIYRLVRNPYDHERNSKEAWRRSLAKEYDDRIEQYDIVIPFASSVYDRDLLLGSEEIATVETGRECVTIHRGIGYYFKFSFEEIAAYCRNRGWMIKMTGKTKCPLCGKPYKRGE
jgi:hypothetical protein